jgi:hypothetical protein
MTASAARRARPFRPRRGARVCGGGLVPLARRLTLLLALAGCLLGLERPARAEPLPIRTTGINQRGGRLTISVGLSDLIGPAERRRLTSGFASRILIRAQLRRADRAEPIVVISQRAEIVYDLWDETFRVRVAPGAGPETVTETRDIDRAIFTATALLRLPVIDASRLDPRARYFLVVRGDLNPISPETVAEVRRWLRPASGTQRTPGDVDGFFGSFVTLFANPRIEHSDRDVRFVSQTFGVSR